MAAINDKATDLVVELLELGADLRYSGHLHLIAATGQDEMLKEALTRCDISTQAQGDVLW